MDEFVEQRAANGEVHNWPRSVVYCVGELATMIRDAARAMAALPAYAHHLAQVVEDLCLSFQRRCTVAYEDATESSLAARIVSNSLARKNAAKKKRHNHAESEADPLSPDDTKPLSLASEASREITLAVAAGQQEASGLLLTVETIIPLWHHVLNIFAGVNAMKSPELQAAGIGVVTSVADMLLLAETEAPHAALTDPSRPRPLELLDVFGPWLFAACQLSEAFVVGKALAYGTLCRLVCRRTEAAPGSWLLGHFYRLLRDGLVARTDMRCAYAILLNSSLLFALALDGASVLIPHYLATIRHLIVDASACTPPPDEDIKQRALSLVCSLVSVGSHLDGLDIVTRNSAPYMVAQARSEVADILRRALAREKSDELKAMCVWGLCVLLFDELHRPQPEQAAVLQWLEDLLHALASPDSSYPVLQAVVDALSSLSLVLDRLAALGQSVTSLVVTSLASHALDQIAAIGQGRAKPSAEGSVVREVECVVDWVMAAAGAHVLQVLVSDAGLMQHIHALLEAGVAGAHGSAPIRDATEAALYKLVNHAGNFPPRSGIAVLTSQLSETDDQPPGAAAPDLAKQLFFLYNQSSLVSLVQPPPSATHLLRPATDTQPREGEGEGEGEKSWGAARVARVMVRDATGKYAWDAVPAYAPAAATAAFRRPSLAPPTDGPRATQESTGAATPAPVSPAAAPEGTAAAADKLHAKLSTRPPIGHPSPLPLCLPGPSTPPPSAPGVVDEDVDGARFTLLENTDKFRRSVSQLDKSAERELQKIGVIYVKRGQEDQNTILRNDKASRSPLFSEFIHALGWTVPVANHLGYTGGLDRLNRTTEQKRHVGNDIVHIVYSEHARDYHPVTITSQFNDAHVVVYPLPDGLFRVQVFRKPGVGLFGPLIDGMVVRKELVGQLVRQTAMNANRYVRYSTQGYEPPYPTRRRYLNDLAHRFSLDPDPPALLAEVVYPTPDRAYLHPPAASSPLPTASPSDSSPATSSAITIAAASGVTPS
ncbi:Rap/ran-GAP protein [Acanthamoeba castellanii str. Neff]|uniref:Rap/ran-GAP protein n=1 Tax=Acanthamoeba castellanii (strain ATCC 30010 / Neff) TaxID=1257118 RepID=L8HC20_ACACF|nr:Rap/ran-GAP protein [Acanthamoeba castellanii str. Neff]ELR22787.1 Rap/ran-GAP protein [Acanthamoeba castellanii str. Neff]